MRKILKFFARAIGGLIAVCLVIVAGMYAYEAYQARPRVVTTLEGVTLGDSLRDTKFKVGELSYRASATAWELVPYDLYSIVTKDGITIQNIPDNIAPDAPELKARVARIRAGKNSEQPTSARQIVVLPDGTIGDLARYERALIASDKAGDTEAATKLAIAIRQMRAQQPAPAAQNGEANPPGMNPLGKYQSTQSESSGPWVKYAQQPPTARYTLANKQTFFDLSAGTVRTIYHKCDRTFATLPPSGGFAPALNGVTCGTSGDKILEKFGQRVTVSCLKQDASTPHYDKDLLRLYATATYNVGYYLYQNRVVGFRVAAPETLAAQTLWEPCDAAPQPRKKS